MLKLVKLDCYNYSLLVDMMDEWTGVDEKIIPWSIRKEDYRNYKAYKESLEIKETTGKYVPDSTYFCLDEERNVFVGAVNIRHYLNEALIIGSGHIGNGVRPSKRGKGYGTKMITLALEECRKMAICEVLICCNKDNVASAKTIIKNGGILENEILDEGVWIQRYWIKL